MIAVVDIDGVLADAGHRQHLVATRPKDWAGFFAAVGEDAPIGAGIVMVRALSGEHTIVLLSGRPESTRGATEAWLASHSVPYDRLVLRAEQDFRRAAEMKADLIRGIGSPHEVAVVVDDDESVVDTLAQGGYRTRLFR